MCSEIALLDKVLCEILIDVEEVWRACSFGQLSYTTHTAMPCCIFPRPVWKGAFLLVSSLLQPLPYLWDILIPEYKVEYY